MLLLLLKAHLLLHITMLYTLNQMIPPPEYRADHICLKSQNARLPQVMLSSPAVNIMVLMVHLKVLSPVTNGL